MRETKLIRIPTRMRPQPWKHLLAWLFRTSVPTHDFVPAWSARDAREQSDKYRDLYYAELKKCEDFADKHSPELSSRTYQPHHPFSCTGCSCFWPCPDYKWAVGRPDLEVILRDKPSEGEQR